MRRCRTHLLLWGLLTGCGAPAEAPRAVALFDLAPDDAAAAIELRDEVRKAISLNLPSRLRFDLRLPRDPVLTFAIGASSRERPTLLAPVVFRVEVDGREVFREVLRRSQGGAWLRRDVDLASFSERTTRVVIDVSLGDGGVDGAEEHVLAHWGNPVIRSRERSPQLPTLILVSIDCLRADHVSAYGYPLPTTPNLDAFARRATLFRDAMGVSTYTLPTHASMLTGLPPSFHGATERRPISPSIESLPELLSQNGYRALALVSAPFLSPFYGFADGFDTYRLSSARAAALVDGALELLDEGEGFPRFLFFHLFDVHLPYSPPREYIERFGARTDDITELHARIERREPPESEAAIEQAIRLYDGEIAYVDHELGRFFRELETRGLFDSSLVVVTADHGEAFFEHGFWEHGRPWRKDGPGLYQEIVHVPLLVKRPGQSEGEEVAGLVSQTDVFATFLDAAGIRRENPWSQSLQRPREKDYAVSEFVVTPATGEAIVQAAVRRGSLKYTATLSWDGHDGALIEPIEPMEEALYDLADDPGERRSLLADGNDRSDELRETLLEYLADARARRQEMGTTEAPLTPELRRKLESLGYIEH